MQHHLATKLLVTSVISYNLEIDDVAITQIILTSTKWRPVLMVLPITKINNQLITGQRLIYTTIALRCLLATTAFQCTWIRYLGESVVGIWRVTNLYLSHIYDTGPWNTLRIKLLMKLFQTLKLVEVEKSTSCQTTTQYTLLVPLLH